MDLFIVSLAYFVLVFTFLIRTISDNGRDYTFIAGYGVLTAVSMFVIIYLSFGMAVGKYENALPSFNDDKKSRDKKKVKHRDVLLYLLACIGMMIVLMMIIDKVFKANLWAEMRCHAKESSASDSKAQFE